MLYKIKDVDDKVHFIFIVAENVKVSINGTTRFVNYTDNDGMNGVVFGSDTYNLANFTNDNVDMHVGTDCTTAGLTETGLIKIKCTYNGYDYIYVR